MTKELHPQNIRVSSYEISVSRPGEPPEQQTFLNSYIADDLALISAALKRGNAGTALSQYLATSPGTTRTDVQKEPLCVRAGCAPDRFPSGRWVTDTNRPLAFSQQFAVNQILRTLSDTSGLFAVNGPPGTGKTTMLRDVIAAIVVNRAIELACLASPSEAFTTTREQWQPAQYPHTITTPNPKLTGFEIVVASSNNGAVENVSTEIPGPKGIDGQWRDAAAAVDYFSQVAGHDAWAMVAARLGNRANRAAFARDFWFNSDSSMQNVLKQSAALRRGLAERRGELSPRAFPGKRPFCRTIRGFTLHHPAPGRIAGPRAGGRRPRIRDSSSREAGDRAAGRRSPAARGG